MRMEGAAFLRARRPEQKQQRYTAILAAARELALRDRVGGVTLAGIAAQVGMHKSALLKYFETREEIFLRLAETEWREWAEALVADLAGTGAEPGAVAVAESLGRSFSDRPLFCQLLIHSPLTLERNVSLEVVRDFKRVAMQTVEEVVPALHRALPALGPTECLDLLATTALVAAGLWQAAHPPPQVAALHAEMPSAALYPDLPTSLVRFVRIYLAGLLEERGME
jgi:AcrR family transcriptional regulator